MLRISDNDISLFKLISTCGVCTLEQAGKIYSGKGYHYKRVQRLEDEGYLIKRGKYLELTTKSADLIGESKYRFRLDEVRETHSEIANIALNITNMSVISNRDIRTQYGLNRKTHFKGVLEHDDIYYFFYLLSEQPSKQFVGSIKSELKTFSASGIARHSIIFAPTMTAMSAFGIEACKQEELFLLPYPAGLTYLNNYFNLSTQQYIHSLIPGAVKTLKPFANYETHNHYITFLILNDIAKRYALSAYYKIQHTKPVKIICLDVQKNIFSKQYPRAEIISFPEQLQAVSAKS
ncbi:MAG: hypothetical protein PHT79_09775 [Syntrophomonadaceae bacterium]|nr:hypothetical protein [Syntrophomonadaceae bacterium]MDD4550030.1 hypothetical protein [Syntrophomonadaceae bacterium]